jgi:hypothetical protein
MKKLLGIAPLLVLVLSCAPATSGIGGGDDNDDNDNDNGSEGEGEGEGEDAGEGEGESPCGDDCEVCINGECADDGGDDECVGLDDDICVDDGLLCNDGTCDLAEAVTCPGLAPGDETDDPAFLLVDGLFEVDADLPCDDGVGVFISALVLNGSGADVSSIVKTSNFDFVLFDNSSTEDFVLFAGCTTNSVGDFVGFLAENEDGQSNYVCGEIE